MWPSQCDKMLDVIKITRAQFLDSHQYMLDSNNNTDESTDIMPKRSHSEMALADSILHTQPDLVIKTIHAFIQGERMRNFSFLGRHSHRYMRQADLLGVSRATSCDIKQFRNRHRKNSRFAAFSDENFFIFSEPMCDADFNRLVAITTDPGCIPTVDNMTVTVPAAGGAVHTSSAAAWIRSTYDNDDDARMKFRAQQYEEQQLWWKSTGKVFRLLHLPGELRVQIYLQIVGPILLPDVENSRVVLGRGLVLGNAHATCQYRDPDIEPPNLTLLRVSKQVHAEALMVAHRDTFKRLRMFSSSVAEIQPGLLYPQLIRPLRSSAPHKDFLRNIQLEMSAACYFASIDVQPEFGTPLKIRPGNFRLVTLAGFPALRRLDCRFISPKHPDAVCPWATQTGQSQHGAHSCQKVWIEWFFAMAFQRLKALEQPGRPIAFSLSGCVKTSTREKWHYLLNDRMVDHVPEVRDLVARIAERARDGPIACACSAPCSKAGAAKLKRFEWDEGDVRHIDGLQEHIDDGYWCFRD